MNTVWQEDRCLIQYLKKSGFDPEKSLKTYVKTGSWTELQTIEKCSLRWNFSKLK